MIPLILVVLDKEYKFWIKVNILDHTIKEVLSQ